MQNYGLAHVWAQGDFVTRGIALALLIMSWSVIVIKGWNVMRLKRLTKNAEQQFWHSDDLADGVKKLGAGSSTPQDNPFLALALSGQEAADHHHQTQPHLHDRMDVSDWVTRCLKDTMDESVARMQSGLAILASIGSTAPFVGLFGTVWGIYHALLAIGASGQSSIRSRSRSPVWRSTDHDRVRSVCCDSGGARLQRLDACQQGCRRQTEPLCARSARLLRDGRPSVVVQARRRFAPRHARQLIDEAFRWQ